MSEQVIKSLKKLLANTYTLYLKTQNYHWNVKGVHFAMLHAFFEQEYTSLGEMVDEIAERIRKLHADSPGSFTEFLKLKTIPEARGKLTDVEMLDDLRKSRQALLKTLPLIIKACQKVNDEGTQDMVIDHIKLHEKSIWMLTASLEKK